jgi:hypothetical protein
MNQNISNHDLTWKELHEIAADPMAKTKQRFIAYKRMLVAYDWYFEHTNNYDVWLKGRGHCLQLRELRASIAKINAKQAGELYQKYCPWR